MSIRRQDEGPGFTVVADGVERVMSHTRRGMDMARRGAVSPVHGLGGTGRLSPLRSLHIVEPRVRGPQPLATDHDITATPQ